MDNQELLKNTNLFTKISNTHFLELLSEIEEVTIPARTTFIKEGERADALYVLKEGVVQVFTLGKANEELILARLEEGAYFGEQALLGETPGLRTASVRALTDAVLLKIQYSMFLKTVAANESLKKELKKIGFQQLAAKLQAIEINETLKKVYISPMRGEITQYRGNFLHMPAVISKINLPDGREIIASRVVGKNIQYFGETNIQNSLKLSYEGPSVFRELQLHEGRLVSITTYGEWDALKELCSRIFEKKGLNEAELKQFQEGSLSFVETIIEEEDAIVCNCMYISKMQIQESINKGCTNVEEISKTTGAGSVCGSCVPVIQTMLGHNCWQAMHIIKLGQLSPDSRGYRLVPIKNIPLPKFKPGQHIVIQCEIDGNWVERSYTLTSTPDNSQYYEIAIKREEKGLFSRWLFENDEHIPFVRTSLPSGHIAIDTTKSTDIVCITAGIGITPAVCFARAVSTLSNSRRVFILHSARNKECLVYDAELEALSNICDKIKYMIHLTQEKGRIKSELISALAKEHTSGEFFICGPKEFENMAKAALVSAGINENQIMIEQFTNAGGPSP